LYGFRGRTEPAEGIEQKMERSVTLEPIDGHTSVQTEPEATYIQAATSDNTRIAYQSDIDHYIKSGGVLPAVPSKLAPNKYNGLELVIF
jgi:hypothetical protein